MLTAEDIPRDFGGGDFGHAPAHEPRTERLIDAASDVLDGAFSVDGVVGEQVVSGFVEPELSDLRADGPLFAMSPSLTFRRLTATWRLSLRLLSSNRRPFR